MATNRKFLTYNPYLSFSNPSNVSFLTHLGQLDLDDDIAALFELGREAYSRITPVPSQAHLEELFSTYFEFIEFMRGALKKAKCRWPASPENNDIEDYWNRASDEFILLSTMRYHLLLNLDEGLSKPRVLRKIFLIQALVEIDKAIFLKVTRKGPITSAIAAAFALSNAKSLEAGEKVFQSAKTDFAYRGVNAWKDRNPKQKEKNFVFQCWQQWQKKRHSYPSKAAFARDMLTKCEHLTSQKKIEDWCRKWEANMEPIGLSEHLSGTKLTGQE